MSATVIRETPERLTARRRELLAACRLSEEELWDRADLDALTAEEADVLERIREIDFLLGHEH